MIEHFRKQNAIGNDVVIVEVSGSGGGAFYSPSKIRVAEIEHGTSFTQLNAKNVKERLGNFEFNNQSSRGPDSNYSKQLKSAFDKANKVITETDLKHRQANKQAMALIESKTDHGFLRNQKDEQIAMVWFDKEKNEMQASYYRGDKRDMPDITLEKTTKNDKNLYFGKHDNDIIMVLQNPKHPDKLQFVIFGKDEDIKNAKMVDLKPSILLKERGEKDITVKKINQDLKINLNIKNKEVSKAKGLGI